MGSRSAKGAAVALVGGLAFVLVGCGSLSSGVRPDTLVLTTPGTAADAVPAPVDAPGAVAFEAAALDAVAAASETPSPAALAPEPEVAREAPAALVHYSGGLEGEAPSLELAADASDATTDVAQAQAQAQSTRREAPIDEPIEEYDPWEPFNEKMFTFNYNLDKHVLKPVAKAWDFVVPKEVQNMISRGMDNIQFVPRVVNNLLQAKWGGAGREMARFLINSTVGIAGFWDMAKQEWGIEKSSEDFGQTLGVWGSGPGPYLVLPFLAPLTVRDGIGKLVDSAMDPLSYFLPFIWERLVMKIGDTINDRSLNLELFEGVEETTVDLYTAVRNFYLQRRARQIRE